VEIAAVPKGDGVTPAAGRPVLGSGVPPLASYPTMMQHDRMREGLRVCRAAWLIDVSVREYREIEAGDREPSLDTYERISELYEWPQTFVRPP
jgi:hypothetical protein